MQVLLLPVISSPALLPIHDPALPYYTRPVYSEAGSLYKIGDKIKLAVFPMVDIFSHLQDNQPGLPFHLRF